MDQMTANVKHNADSATQAAHLAEAAADVATRGSGVVDDVVRTMSEITSSSQKIGDIVGVIDGIAFQTNILALNAAVEAARAGEQGRGFAVVASEVRSLAQRSATAAKKIKTLIESSTHTVDQGAALDDDRDRAVRAARQRDPRGDKPRVARTERGHRAGERGSGSNGTANRLKPSSGVIQCDFQR
jgi:methyl-accepting chemotaxis protein